MPDVGRQHRIVLVVVEHQDFRELALRAHRVDFELAEQPADGDVLGGVEMLVAQEHHLVLDQRRLERLEGFGIQPLLEIEAVDFRAQPGAETFHLERGRACADAYVGGDVDVHGDPRRAWICRDYAANGQTIQARVWRLLIARPWQFDRAAAAHLPALLVDPLRDGEVGRRGAVVVGVQA